MYILNNPLRVGFVTNRTCRAHRQTVIYCGHLGLRFSTFRTILRSSGAHEKSSAHPLGKGTYKATIGCLIFN